MRNSSVKLLPVLPGDKILRSSDESRSREPTDLLETTIFFSILSSFISFSFLAIEQSGDKNYNSSAFGFFFSIGATCK